MQVPDQITFTYSDLIPVGYTLSGRGFTLIPSEPNLIGELDSYYVLFDGTVDGKQFPLIYGRSSVSWIYTDTPPPAIVIGDSDQNGRFNSSDLVRVFQAGEYEDSILANSTWEEGDWDGNKEFKTRDLILAFQEGRYEGGALALGSKEAVPEPSTLWLLLAIPFSIGCWRRQRNRT
jgi:hypothetical protein